MSPQYLPNLTNMEETSLSKSCSQSICGTFHQHYQAIVHKYPSHISCHTKIMPHLTVAMDTRVILAGISPNELYNLV